MNDQAMTREELKQKINNLARFLTYPELDDLHAIDDCDAALLEELAQVKHERDTYKALCDVAHEHRRMVCDHRDRLEVELAQWDTFRKTDIYQQFTDVRAKLAQVTQDRDEWKQRHANLTRQIDERDGNGAGWWGSTAAKFLTRAQTAEDRLSKAQARIAEMEGQP